MQAKELKSLTSEELMNKLNDFKSELFSLRFQLATGQLENTARIKFRSSQFHVSTVCP